VRATNRGTGDLARTTVEEQRRIRRMSQEPSRPEWDPGRSRSRPNATTRHLPSMPDESSVNPDIDAPDEWGIQSFPASDPPQNW
jgi:hypothetical protein